MTSISESTDTFRKKLTSADTSNIVTVLDMLTFNARYSQFEEDYELGFSAMLESLQVSVGLFSLKAADFPKITPLMSEADKQAEIAKVRTDGQKMGLSLWIAKGNGPWEYASECVLQNNANSESYVPLLVPYLTVNEVLLIGRDFKLGVKVESKWQGVLKVNDYLVIQGSWRQRVTFTAKKNELELVLADIEALKLAIYGRLTGLPPNSLLAGDANGIAVPISTPLPIALGGTGGSAKSWVGLTGNDDIAGVKHLTNTTQATLSTNGALVVDGGVGIAKNLIVDGFTKLGDVGIKVKYIIGTTAALQGEAAIVAHGLDASKIIAVLAAVEYATSQYIGPGYTGGYFYNVSWSTTVNIVNKAGDSANILSKPCRWTVFYKE